MPLLNPSYEPKAYIVRVACTTVLELGCEYVVPGTDCLLHAGDKDMVLSPTKSFTEKHKVQVAHLVFSDTTIN